MAAQVPDMNYPAPGAGGLPLPRTVVESMAMLAYARQSVRWQNFNPDIWRGIHLDTPPLSAQGVTGFWARSPSTEAGDVHMHWPTGEN